MLVVAKNQSKLGRTVSMTNQGMFKVAEQYGPEYVNELSVLNRQKAKASGNEDVLEAFRN